MRRLVIVIVLGLALVAGSVLAVGPSPAGAAPACPHGARVRRDVAYRSIEGVERRLTSLAVYVPAQRGDCDPAPVVVWVHGGGWMIGDKRNAVADKVRLFNDAGYVFVSVNYRLTDPDASEPVVYPTHNEDVAAALAWIVGHIDDHGGDADRIALLGHSAGAQIVASVSTDERYLAEHDLDLGTIRCTGPLDTEGFDVAAIASRPIGARVYTQVFGDDPDTWRDASPLSHVAPGKDIPEMLLVKRGTAVRQAVVDEFAAALRDSDVAVTVVDATGLTHADVNRDIGAPGDDVTTPALTEFLAGCLE